jgi:hypothetical protein
MFFFFIFIPGSLVFLAIALLCIRFFAKGIAIVNLSSEEHKKANQRAGIKTIIFALLALTLAGWLYWRYIWIW